MRRRPSTHAAVALLAAVCSFVAAGGKAAPPSVERFNAQTWPQLQRDLQRPAIVVFTATYCVSCPALLAHLSNELKTRSPKAPIVAVVIDEADDEQLMTNGHYERASRLFVFEGNETSLRHQIDPRWRGVTPYVALLPTQGKPVFVAGTPSDAQLTVWSGK
jgi:hypothetical protein